MKSLPSVMPCADSVKKPVNSWNFGGKSAVFVPQCASNSELEWDADLPDLPDRKAVAQQHHGNQVNQRSIFFEVCQK